MSDQQRKVWDNTHRAAKATKEDYSVSLHGAKRDPTASWSGVSLAHASGLHKPTWRTGLIHEVSPSDIARHYFRTFKKEWTELLQLLREKYDQELEIFVRDTFMSHHLSCSFLGGYERITPMFQRDCLYSLNTRQKSYLHLFYSLSAAFASIRDSGTLPPNAPIYLFIEEVRRCRLAGKKVVFKTIVPDSDLVAMGVLQARGQKGGYSPGS